MCQMTVRDILQKIADSNKVIDKLRKLKEEVCYIPFDVEELITKIEQYKTELVKKYDQLTEYYIEEAEFIASVYEHLN